MDPAEEAAQRELITAMTEAVVGLPEPYRRTVLLRYYSGLSPREIAEQEAAPLETVKSRLKRGLVLIRTALEKPDGSDRSRALVILAFGYASGARDASLLIGSAMFTKKLFSLCLIFILCAAFAFYLATQNDEPSSLPEPIGRLAREASTGARRTQGKAGPKPGLRGDDVPAAKAPTPASTQTLRGRVWNAHEQPAGGAILRIRSAVKTPSRDEAAGEAAVLAEGLADPDGFFTMTTSDLKPPFHLDAKGEDGARGALFLTHLDADDIRVELGLNFRLEGRVRDAAGRSVAHARLSVEDWFGGARLRRETQSDQNGDYCFPSLPSHGKRTASQPMLIVRNPRFATRRILITGHGRVIAESFAFGEEAILRRDVSLSPAIELTGRVRTAPEGRPLSGARIRVWLPQLSGATNAASAITSVRTNTEGLYRVTGLPSSSPNGLERQQILIEVSASGFPSQWHVLERTRRGSLARFESGGTRH
jgi:protocatechuate 3,4-dioxygenase beta subunit